MKKNILVALTLFLLGMQSAFAYIDPGSGSAIISLIIGFFVAVGVLVKTFWYKLKKILGFSKNKPVNSKNEGGQTDTSEKKSK